MEGSQSDVPLAYLISSTGYGTWLHGDDRGSVDRTHNHFNTPFLPPDPARRGRKKGFAKHEAFTLDGRRRQVVQDSIVELCDERGWDIHALDVRTNHVHIVVSTGICPKRARADLKARCTLRLRQNELVDANRPLWTRRGSARYLWKDRDVADACRYVEEGQGDDLPFE